MGTSEVDSELRHKYTNMWFFRFQFFCLLRKLYGFFLTCVWYCLMVVTGEVMSFDTYYKCVSSFEILQATLRNCGSSYLVETNDVDGDLRCTYVRILFRNSILYWIRVRVCTALFQSVYNLL